MAKLRCSFLRDEKLNVHGTIVDIDSEGLLEVSGEEKDVLLSLRGFALVEEEAKPKKVDVKEEEKVEEKEEPKKAKSTKKNTKK